MKEKSPAKLFSEIMDGLSQASGACSQIIHQHQDPRFMVIRQTLDLTKEGIAQLIPVTGRSIAVRPS